MVLLLLVDFKCLPHRLRGGTTGFSINNIFYFFLRLGFLLLILFCSFFVSLCRFSFMERECRACRIQYDDMALRCLLSSLPNIVVSLSRIFVTIHFRPL